MAYIDPNVLFKGGQISPFTSFQKGLGAARERQQFDQQSALRDLQMQQAGLGLEQQQYMQPLQRRKSELGLGQVERDIQNQEIMRGLGESLASGEITEDQFLQEYQGLFPEQVPAMIQKRKAQEAATQKFLAEQAEKERKFQLEQKKLNYQQSKDTIDRQIAQMQPMLNYNFDQAKLSNQLSSDLQNKHIKGRGLTQDMVKNVTKSTVLTAPVLKQIDKILEAIKDEKILGLIDKIPGEKKARLESDLRQLQLVYKSEEFANLGVLTGPDLELLNAITGDPTALFNLNASSARAKLNSMKKNILQGYNSKLRQNNFKPFNSKELINTVPDFQEKETPTETNYNLIPTSTPTGSPYTAVYFDAATGKVMGN